MSRTHIEQQEIWEIPGVRDLSCTVRRSDRAKYIRLTVHPEKGVILTVPAGAKDAQARTFLQKQSGWLLRTIRKQQCRQPAKEPDKTPSADNPGKLLSRQNGFQELYPQNLTIPGISENPLTVQYQWRDVCWTAVRLDAAGNTLIVSGNLFAAEQLREAWLDFLKRMAAERFLPRLRELSAEMGSDFAFRSMSVRVQKGRWGSCSGRKTISLNAMLLLVSPDLADAVMFHELCHLQEMNHSAGFYDLLLRYCPDWQKKKKLLAVQQKNFPSCFQ